MTLVLLCVAAGLLLAYAASALTALALWLARSPLQRCAPSARARIYCVAAYIPAFVASAALLAALAPSFGWAADHCTSEHFHPHICVAHHVHARPEASLLLLMAFGVSRIGFVLFERAHALWAMQRLERSWTRVSQTDAMTGSLILPSDNGNAFVLGLWRPRLYTTRGLLHGPLAVHLDVVLAHERAHVHRLDGLHRFFAGLGLCLHLPLVARWVATQLAEAQEMAADDAAATAVGDRVRVASALVALARSASRYPAFVTSFTHESLAARVHQLLRPSGDRQALAPRSIALGAALSLLAVGCSAEAIHHGVEMLLGVVGG